MPASCSVCSSRLRERVDESLIAGDSFASVARLSGLTAASIRRHAESHLRRDRLAPDRNDAVELSEVGDRWLAALKDAESVRDDAVRRGDAKTLLASVETRNALLRGWHERYGRSLNILDELSFYGLLGQLVGHAIHRDPRIGRDLIHYGSEGHKEGIPEVIAELERATAEAEKEAADLAA